MKYTLLISFVFVFLFKAELTAQSLSSFLGGTWKMEGKEIYEHWDVLNEHNMKGFSYKIKDGKIVISEYRDINLNQSEIIYTDRVLNQNEGKGINFKLINSDTSFVFENPEHDSPKKIEYQKLSDIEIFVRVSDGGQKGFAYKMKKQDVKPVEKDTTVSNPNYDKELAEKLGADDYGMKSYIFVILKTGTNQSTDKEFISEKFKGHMENIHRLVDEEKLIVAGPLGKNENNYRGIFILNNITTMEEAEEILQNDPAVKSGLLDVEIYNWYGSAALPEYLISSKKISKVKP